MKNKKLWILAGLLTVGLAAWASGYRDFTEGMRWGMGDGTANATMESTGALSIDNDLTVGLSGTASTRIIEMKAAATQRESIRYWSGTDLRWNVQKDQDDDFKWTRYTGGSGGTFQDYPLKISNTNGTVSLAHDLIFTERASLASTPAAGFGYLWVKNTAPSTLIFTDDTGTDVTLGSGGGGGDVVGPASATDNAIPRYDTLTGKLLQNSTVLIDDSGNVTLATGDTVDGRELSTDGAKLDGIEAGATADQTDAEIETAYNAQVAVASDAEALAGSSPNLRRWTPGLVARVAYGQEVRDDPTSSTSYTPNGENKNQITLTLAGATTINAPTGTLVDGARLFFRIKQGAGPYSLTWNTVFKTKATWGLSGAIPAISTTANEWNYFEFVYNAGVSEWHLINSPTAGITDLTGEVTAAGPGSVAATLGKTAITNRTNTSPATGDGVLLTDASASDGLIKTTIADILALYSPPVTTSNTVTFTNKRNTPRQVNITSNSATPTLDIGSYDVIDITGQSTTITSMSSGLTGTPALWEQRRIYITGAGAVGITWGSSYASGVATLPSTTVPGKTLKNLMEWDGTYWRCMATGSNP